MQKPSPSHRLLTLAALLAALPAAAAPNNITDLGTLKNDNSGGGVCLWRQQRRLDSGRICG